MGKIPEPSEPVPGFPIKYIWQTEWVPLFDLQVELIRGDLRRAMVEDRVIVYLSCPISSRGGGHSRTNVEIAKATENRVLSRLGERFWILNPARYQMESKEGAGMVREHAKRLGMTDEQFAALPSPVGGDYMRMWTKVLVENRPGSQSNELIGDFFDMYYFQGPSDVSDFFTQGTGISLTAAIEGYFARKFTTDLDFCIEYNGPPTASNWEEQRKSFFRYYAVRASANFSPGSHDEWNIFRGLNERRRKIGVSEQIAGFFDGRQISMAATEGLISSGYAC